MIQQRTAGRINCTEGVSDLSTAQWVVCGELILCPVAGIYRSICHSFLNLCLYRDIRRVDEGQQIAKLLCG